VLHGPQRGRLIGSLLTLAGVALVAGCGSGGSNKSVTSESIVSDPEAINALANPSFEQHLDDWSTTAPGSVDISVKTPPGHDGNALLLKATGTRVPDTVAVQQETILLPSTDEGAVYRLAFMAKTDGLTRPVQVELRLNYRKGNYDFFTGGPNGARSGIPHGSHDWRRVTVTAIARSRLESIDAFVIDSGPGELGGTIWIDDVHLDHVK
jgi:hypothetical protein